MTDQKNGAIKETVAMVAKQLMQNNFTDWDTRTPPKIKVHRTTKRPAIAEIEEVSHMGVAEPVDVEKFMETTVKEVPKTTTDSGLSTWILLSGNSPSTKPPKKEPVSKPTAKPTPKPTPRPMSTVKFVEKTTKYPPKPKTTTRKPVSTTTKKVTNTPKIEVTTEAVQTTSKPTTKTMTKIKASILNSALSNKTRTTTQKPQNNPKTTVSVAKTTTPTSTTTAKPSTTANIDSSTENELGPEAKIVDLELLESRETTKKPTRKPAANANANKNQNNANNNKKKNKIRRKKPEETPNTKTKTNATKVATKEKPITTQFYNYLSREVMPTVGVGLVGLVLTAGLASYFLFPFNTLRRNYVGALDRKDDHAYDTYFSDGELEQDFIGKMIEGGYEYNSASNSVYQSSSPYNRYDTSYKYDDRIVSERQKETGYTVDDRRYENKFIPDNFVPVTPAVVPEHGPRNFPESLKDPATQQEVTTRKFVVGNIPEGYIPGNPIGVPEHGPRSLRIRRNAPKPIPIASIEEVVYKKGKKHSRKNFVLRKKESKSIPVASIEEVIYQRSRRSVPMRPKSFQTDSRSVENEVTSSKLDTSALKDVLRSRKTRQATSNVRRTQVPKALENGVIRYKHDFGVPKHGPRSLRLKRDVPESTSAIPKDQENEVTSPKDKFHKYKLTKYAEMKKNATLSTTEAPTTEKNETNGTSTVYYEEQPTNIFSFLRNVFEMKVRIGLNFLLNTTETFSKYLRGVQERVEKAMVENRERYKKKVY